MACNDPVTFKDLNLIYTEKEVEALRKKMKDFALLCKRLQTGA